jgi:hypothetical protein
MAILHRLILWLGHGFQFMVGQVVGYVVANVVQVGIPT